MSNLGKPRQRTTGLSIMPPSQTVSGLQVRTRTERARPDTQVDANLTPAVELMPINNSNIIGSSHLRPLPVSGGRLAVDPQDTSSCESPSEP